MTNNELREIINRVGVIKRESGEREITLTVHQRLMFIVQRISAIEQFYRLNDFSPTIVPHSIWIDLLLEIYDFHSSAIEIGKYRNTFPVFVKERADYQNRKKIDITILLFCITQKITTIPNYYFKTELIGECLGMIYGYLDNQNIYIEKILCQHLFENK